LVLNILNAIKIKKTRPYSIACSIIIVIVIIIVIIL
jgi:hypothetical protein